MIENNEAKDKLQLDKLLLENQLPWLEIFYRKCQQIGLKENYAEFGCFETLCFGILKNQVGWFFSISD